MTRIRLDKLLVKREFVNDIKEAKKLIENGDILVNGSVQKSIKSFVDPGDAIEYLKQKPKYVSRGGFKLEKAIIEFGLDVKDIKVLDVGASTGGFTDCLLQMGAKQVFAVDVGHGQLDHLIRKDPRVIVYEKTNAKTLNSEMLNTTCELGVMDVSFTSVLPLLKPVISCLDPKRLIVLIKPQFEVDHKLVNSKGIVTNKEDHVEVIKKIVSKLPDELAMVQLSFSPIKGVKGNIEYLCLLENSENGEGNIDTARIEEIVNLAFSELRQ